MNSDNSGKKYFWTSLPVILSGVAIIITAMGGILAIVYLSPHVVEPSKCIEIEFYASPSSIIKGEKTILAWDVSNAKSIIFEPDIGITSNTDFKGFKLIEPLITTVYKLTAFNGEERHKSIIVEVEELKNPPVANNDYATVNQDSTNNQIYVLTNDYDNDSDILEITRIISYPSHGKAIPAEDYVLYTPEPLYYGTDQFEYEISDGKGGTASAIVYINVTEVIPEGVKDQYYENCDNCDYFANYAWQEFVPIKRTITKVEVNIAKFFGGSPDLKLSIEKPLGNILTYRILAVTSLPAGICDWVSFDVPDLDLGELGTGDKFYIVLSYDLGGEYGWCSAWEGPDYEYGSSSIGGDWDFCFRTYGY